MTDRAVKALALFSAVQSVWSDIHPYCDQVLQRGDDAINKGRPGWAGRKACARHVASYSAAQFAAAYAVTRVLGSRPSVTALLAGTAVNGVTHYVIDRRTPLKAFLHSKFGRATRLVGPGKQGYIERATVQRGNGVVDEAGPGTALTELDQAVHRAIAVAASVTTALIATRSIRK